MPWYDSGAGYITNEYGQQLWLMGNSSGQLWDATTEQWVDDPRAEGNQPTQTLQQQVEEYYGSPEQQAYLQSQIPIFQQGIASGDPAYTAYTELYGAFPSAIEEYGNLQPSDLENLQLEWMTNAAQGGMTEAAKQAAAAQSTWDSGDFLVPAAIAGVGALSGGFGLGELFGGSGGGLGGGTAVGDAFANETLGSLGSWGSGAGSTLGTAAGATGAGNMGWDFLDEFNWGDFGDVATGGIAQDPFYGLGSGFWDNLAQLGETAAGQSATMNSALSGSGGFLQALLNDPSTALQTLGQLPLNTAGGSLAQYALKNLLGGSGGGDLSKLLSGLAGGATGAYQFPWGDAIGAAIGAYGANQNMNTLMDFMNKALAASDPAAAERAQYQKQMPGAMQNWSDLASQYQKQLASFNPEMDTRVSQYQTGLQEMLDKYQGQYQDAFKQFQNQVNTLPGQAQSQFDNQYGAFQRYVDKMMSQTRGDYRTEYDKFQEMLRGLQDQSQSRYMGEYDKFRQGFGDEYGDWKSRYLDLFGGYKDQANRMFTDPDYWANDSLLAGLNERTVNDLSRQLASQGYNMSGNLPNELAQRLQQNNAQYAAQQQKNYTDYASNFLNNFGGTATGLLGQYGQTGLGALNSLSKNEIDRLSATGQLGLGALQNYGTLLGNLFGTGVQGNLGALGDYGNMLGTTLNAQLQGGASALSNLGQTGNQFIQNYNQGNLGALDSWVRQRASGLQAAGTGLQDAGNYANQTYHLGGFQFNPASAGSIFSSFAPMIAGAQNQTYGNLGYGLNSIFSGQQPSYLQQLFGSGTNQNIFDWLKA